MYTNKIKRNTTLLIIIFACLATLCVTATLSVKNFALDNVYGLEHGSAADEGGITEFIEIKPFSSGDKDPKDIKGVINLAGQEKQDEHKPITDFKS